MCRDICRPAQRNSMTSREVAMPLGRALMTSFLPRLWIGGPTYVIHFQVPDWLGRKVCVCVCVGAKSIVTQTNSYFFRKTFVFYHNFTHMYIPRAINTHLSGNYIWLLCVHVTDNGVLEERKEN